MMKKATYMFLLLVLIFALPVSVYAEGGDGSGGDSGDPLTLATSSVPDGCADVPLNAQITLTFSKNVINMSVRDNNMACFSMTDSSGVIVGISVLMGDDQVDPNVKRLVTIKPKNELSPDTAYILTISRNLTSKSGVSLGDDVTLTFTTVSAPVPSPSPAVSPAPSEKPAAAQPTGTLPTAVSLPSPSEAEALTSGAAAPASPPSGEQTAASAEISTAAPMEGMADETSGNDQTAALPSGTAIGAAIPENAARPSFEVWLIAGGAVLVVAAAGIVMMTRRKK
jgi:hypothetical protein